MSSDCLRLVCRRAATQLSPWSARVAIRGRGSAWWSAFDHPIFRGRCAVLRSKWLGGRTWSAGADDGAAALELIKAHLPDVALLDYRMPGMDGAHRLRRRCAARLPTRVPLISARTASRRSLPGTPTEPPNSCSRIRLAPKIVRRCSIARRARGGALAGRETSPGRFSQRAPWPRCARGARVLCRIACVKHPAIAAGYMWRRRH